MFVCWKCGQAYEEPHEVPATWGQPAEYTCPHCGASWDGFEAKQCEVCGEWKHPDDMDSSGCCKACVDAATADPEKFSQFLRDKDIDDEFFVDFILSQAELVEFGKKRFREMSKAEQLSRIKDFVSGDREMFAKWLEVQNNDAV